MNRSELKGYLRRMQERARNGSMKTFRGLDSANTWLGGRLIPLLSALPRGATVLEIGTGDKEALTDIRRSFPHLRLIGTNFHWTDAPRTLSEVKPPWWGRVPGLRKMAANQIIELHASASRLPLARNSVDAVFSVWTAPYVPDKLGMLEEIHRVLRPNGTGLVDYLNDAHHVDDRPINFYELHPDLQVAPDHVGLTITKREPHMDLGLQLSLPHTTLSETRGNQFVRSAYLPRTEPKRRRRI